MPNAKLHLNSQQGSGSQGHRGHFKGKCLWGGFSFSFLSDLLNQCSQLQMLDFCISIGSALCVSVWMDSSLKASFNFQVIRQGQRQGHLPSPSHPTGLHLILSKEGATQFQALEILTSLEKTLEIKQPSHMWSMRMHVMCCLVMKSCLTLCNPKDCSMPGFPVLRYLLESDI